MDRVKGISIEISAETKKFNKALKDLKSDASSTQKELKYVNNALKLDPKNTDLVKQKFELLNKQISATEKSLEEMKKAKDEADKKIADGAEINEENYRRLVREISAAEQQLKSLKKENDRFANSCKELGGKLTDIGKKGMAVSAGVAAIGTASVAAASQFEDAFSKVLTIADTTEVSTEELKKSIKDLSNETGIAATDIADNVYNAISAGQKTGDAVNFVRNATKLAKAGFTESSAALDILTTAMNAYGLEADKVTEVSDLLIQTQNLGKTTVSELSSSMGKVIPTAKANNVELNQLCAGYAILTANGIATAESTTYMNAMLNELGKGGTKVDKILREKTGMSFSQLSEQGSTLGDVLGILNDYAQENNKSFGDLWSSSEAGKAGLVLLGDGADTFNSKLKEMNNSAGATNTAFDKLDTNSAKAKKALNQIKNVGIDLGETLLITLQPVIEGLANKIKSLCQWFSNLSDGQKKTIVTIGLITAAIPPLFIMIGNLIHAFAVLSLTMEALPLLEIITLIGIFTATVIGQIAATDDETAAMKKLHEESKKRLEDYEKQKKAAEEQAKADITEINHVETLKNELSRLADENGNVTENNKARVKFILNELNDALGTEYQLTGNQIEKYKELANSIDDVILKKKAEILLQSKEDGYKTAIKNIEASKNAVDQAAKSYEKAKQEYEKYVSEHITNSDTVTWVEADNAKKLKKTMMERKDILDDARTEHINYMFDIKEYEDMSVEIISGNSKKVVEEFNKRAGYAKEGGEKLGKNYINGIEATDTAEATNQLVDETANNLTDAVQNKQESLSSIGKSIVDGLATGITAKNTLLSSRISNMVSEVDKKMRAGFQVNSPAKTMIPIGEALPEGVAVGVANKTNKLLESINKQAEQVTDAYNNVVKAYVDSIAISLSKYNIWQYQNPNAEAIKKQETLLERLYNDEKNQNEIVYQANNRLYSISQLYGEGSKEEIEARREYFKQLEELERLRSQIIEIETEINTPESLKNLFSQARYDSAESAYNLWLAENDDATESEKLEKKKEMLTAQYSEQANKIQDVNNKLWDEIQISGESSEASIELTNQLMQEKQAYIELAKAIEEVNKQKSIVDTEAQREYRRYYSEYGVFLRNAGVSDFDIEVSARKASGYSGDKVISVTNNNYGVTADTAYKVSQKTERELEKIAMQGVL